MTTVANEEALAELLETGSKTGKLAKYAKWVGGLTVLILLAMIAVAAMRARTTAATPQYTTEALTRGSLKVAVSATGNLKPTNKVDVGSELSGLVEQVLVEENDRVKKGEVLAVLDTSKLRQQITRSQAALDSSVAKLAQANATVKEATANLERLREVSRLSGGKVPSKTEMETADATLARAKADQASASASVNDAKATLSSDQINLSKASIRSPINGVVLTRSVEPGQTVAASLQVATLFTIAEDLSKMELKVDVDEADVGGVRNGQKATFTVDAYPGRKYTADVTRVGFGSQTKDNVVSYPTVLNVKNDDLSLRPGMTATAEIATTEKSNVLLVPNAALRFTPGSSQQGTQGRGIVGSLMPGPPRAVKKEKTTELGSTRRIWVLRNGQPAAMEVAVGPTNGRLTEVNGAELQEGMQVITGSLTVAQ